MSTTAENIPGYTNKRGLGALGRFLPKHQKVIEAVQSAESETRTPDEVVRGRQHLLDQAQILARKQKRHP